MAVTAQTQFRPKLWLGVKLGTRASNLFEVWAMRLLVRVLTSLVAAAPLMAGTSFADAAGSNRAQTPPSGVLLTPQPRAQCELSKPPEGIGSNDARVVVLDYERQCYRQLAEIERAKLDELQATARPTSKSVNRSNRGVHSSVHKWPLTGYRVRRDRQLAGR
jgi:hypothetical protein